ncbi:DEAD/DEAH box helicase family protein [Chamaesiphon sp. VAR_69_metabat_338]|uniref:DEAD/DEAH box helicase family protein n=1 Tax=Chamaesiphon sp. VAR_69_metabat_338 TaxID=2964704 RepID=UPI00286EA9F7|nr:DEAD/DEAH box helicase family protein [Chamaesiphon sp. VAR_69_metabat_338]
MPSNFDFLNPDFPQIFDHATNAENLVHSAPRASCFYIRYTLEQAVHWLYANDPYLQLPYDDKLSALIHEQTFRDNLSPNLYPKLRTIQKMGNIAVHRSAPISASDSLHLIEELFHFLYWLCRSYSPNGKTLGKIDFNPQLIQQPQAQGKNELTLIQLQTLETQLSQAEEMKAIALERERQTAAELDRLKAELTALKQTNTKVPDPHNYNETNTRKYLIDVLLREMGWDLTHPDSIEYPVEGMPTSVNPSGKGAVDYVLWDENGLPLAVVEAKRTRRSPEEGKQQAKLYADCLEQKFHQRPVIFYSNGDRTFIWDDRNYPEREIQGFLKKDELQRLIWRRTNHQPLHLEVPDANIAGRSYQTEAIRRISDNFANKSRKALLVMATGTGKTRTAIAIADLLINANWIKRVLFLADRTSLVTQAKRAFTRHLPNVTTVNLSKEQDIDGANIVFSTYPTIMNAIDRIDGQSRKFGSGYFDLIIIDEAHRSVYKKYRYLFDHFDALLLGLTATPRDEVNRDTYQIFDLEQGNPTFAYELDDAIRDGHLVPPTGIDVPFKFLRSGIKYSELSPDEQAEYEEKFADTETGEIPDEINAAALNRWLFNCDTIDQALEVLMERGIKVDGGDRLGKTIIFARRHEHAVEIEKRFNQNYPHYKGAFARIIDNYDKYAQSTLDDFSEADKQPTIAISVDMLDTGVDVPEVVNLMFFKPVYSRVKFNQMIGRGTRLCPDLFGVGLDKQEFLIFDLCANFGYFQQQIKEKDPKPADSLGEKLFKARLELYQSVATSNNVNLNQLQQDLGDSLHQQVASMEAQNFMVRRHLADVEEFSVRERWDKLNPQDLKTIGTTLSQLPNGLPNENPLVKRFDLICLKIQLAILQDRSGLETLRDKVRDLLGNLEEKRTIPTVKAQLPLIEAAQAENWWIDVTPIEIESLRVKIRDLMQFVDRQIESIIYTDFQDELGELTEVTVPIEQTGFSPYQYRKKVEAYIRANQNHIAIAKLRRNLPLTETDLIALEEMLFVIEGLESREKFLNVYTNTAQNLKSFIRTLVGLDRAAAKEAFSKYLQNQQFSANQIRFVEQIIDLLTQQGVMNPRLLYEPPFTDFHRDGLDGVFGDDDADSIVAIVRSFNQAVEMTFESA